MATRWATLSNFYPEPRKLTPKEELLINLKNAKEAKAYKLEGYRNNKKFNIKDIYLYSPSKHIALIQAKSNKEFLIVHDLIFIAGIGYGKLEKNLKKIPVETARMEYQEYSKFLESINC